MSRIAYVNGRYVPHRLAEVAMEDRGYQFADGIYEVIVFFNRTMLDEALHLKRLKQSLDSLRIAEPMPEAALKLVIRELIARNNYKDGYIYMQITRGVAPRNHPFPKNAKPVLTMSVMRIKQPSKAEVENGVPVITYPDIRWGRCDVKSISLLPNALAKEEAVQKGAREAILVNEKDYVTEASHSNAYIVKNGVLITHPQDYHILNGVRRQVLLEIAAKHQIRIEERLFTKEELFAADEVFVTSATSNVLPVATIDGKKIGTGKPGDITKKIGALYQEHVTEQTGKTWN
ncbi:MAG: D-amino-acid transaminase [Rickettsiales bacterium]